MAYGEVITEYKIKGDAYDSKRNLVYIENHTIKKKENGEITEMQTKYNTADGKLIAEVTSNFSKDPFIPDTLFFDHRFNQKQELVFNTTTNAILMTITDLKNGKSKSHTLIKTANMVSGQGFHNYLLKNYNEAKTKIKFIVLPKLDYFAFTIKQNLTGTAGQRKFVLQVSNWILKALVKELVVIYRDSDRTLLNFYGLTNLDSDKNESQILEIIYTN
jgi:hypothetical protein